MSTFVRAMEGWVDSKGYGIQNNQACGVESESVPKASMRPA